MSTQLTRCTALHTSTHTCIQSWCVCRSREDRGCTVCLCWTHPQGKVGLGQRHHPLRAHKWCCQSHWCCRRSLCINAVGLQGRDKEATVGLQQRRRRREHVCTRQMCSTSEARLSGRKWQRKRHTIHSTLLHVYGSFSGLCLPTVLMR